MRFIYDKNAGSANLLLDSKAFHHIFSVRRKNATKSLERGEIFDFANLCDSAIHRYKIISVGKKSAEFMLVDSTHIRQDSPKTHIIQAVISDFDKILPFLNELFVEKISLFYADFSQRNIRVNLERLDAILISSSMQCGRLSKMQIEIFNSLDEVIRTYGDLIALDFGAPHEDLRNLNRFIIGAEGGFSQRERKFFVDSKIRAVSLNHSLILRAQSASIFVASQKIF